MSLEEIRKKNKKNDGFFNETIDYSSINDNDTEKVKKLVFKGFIEKIGNYTLKNLSKKIRDYT